MFLFRNVLYLCYKMLYKLNKLQAVYLVLLSNFSIQIYADFFTALTELEYLLLPHMRIISNLEVYVNMQEQKLALIKRYLDLYTRHSEKVTEAGYLDNPLNVFILVKRLVSDLDNIPEILKRGAEFIPYLLSDQNDILYPDQEDLIGAAEGLVRLQKIYHLNIRDLVEGNLNNLAYTTPMTAGDCYELSQALVIKRKDFNTGHPWMMEAKRKYNEENVSYPFTELDIFKYLNTFNNMTGETNAQPSTQKLFDLTEELKKQVNGHDSKHKDKDLPEYLSNDMLQLSNDLFDVQQGHLSIEPDFDTLYIEPERELPTPTSIKDEKELKTYEALCRGDLVVPPKISNRLTCRYLTENHPFLKLAPYKVEMVYLNPDMMLFHDVLSDDEIENIKEISKPLLTRAQINDPKNGLLTKAAYRIGKVAWIFDLNSDILAQITRRVAHMTGLNMDLTNEKQVVNYGIGGHYEPHYDFTKKTEKHFTFSTNIIATMLFYMSDVAQGGATVFPELGVRLLPVKGTAVLWFNLHPSLEGDYAMRHAACPVLQGDKWVVSKFICRESQIFVKPCNLEYQEEGFNRKIPEPIPKT